MIQRRPELSTVRRVRIPGPLHKPSIGVVAYPMGMDVPSISCVLIILLRNSTVHRTTQGKGKTMDLAESPEFRGK